MFNSAFLKLQTEQLVPEYYTHWSDPLKQIFQFNGKLYLLNLIKELKTFPEEYKKYNPKNGWGDYKTAVEWLQEIYDNWQDDYEIEINW